MIRRFVIGVLESQNGWTDPLGGFIQEKILQPVFRPVRLLKDFLNGVWLGHSLHALLTDVPIGAFTAAIVLDIFNVRAGADIAIALGILGMIGAALAGWADYTDAYGKVRNYGTLHQLLMLVALVLYIVSLGMRLSSGALDRALPITLSVVGYLIIAASAYIGGEMVYGLGNMIDRHAFRAGGAKWAALDVSSIEPDKPTKARAGAQTLVVVRKGDRLFALHDVCAHQGCSLSAGKIVGDSIECPCHGSRYQITTGHVVRGPSTFDQPSFQIRESQGKLEAFRAGQGE
ncbi:MAG: hypothetical protein AUH85_06880 [Chloroflexi bacterium 13_1_40CM_4_68_4]|nr:MAG: hypothetical protein AUH85_06880 [Chloroflexi bacterium 13_1_40CM_4_68_4]